MSQEPKDIYQIFMGRSLSHLDRRIEKRRDDRQQQIGLIDHCYMRCGREDGQLGIGQTGRRIAHNAATKETEHLHGVFGAHNIRITDDG